MITILDGGMGQELILRSGGKATPMWSLQALLDAPDLISQVHDDYFASGALVATANTYVILPDRLKHFGFPERQAELMQKACKPAECGTPISPISQFSKFVSWGHIT